MAILRPAQRVMSYGLRKLLELWIIQSMLGSLLKRDLCAIMEEYLQMIKIAFFFFFFSFLFTIQ